MVTSIFILIASILASLYALPYGIWEYKNNNKLGGAMIYFFAAACIIAAGIKLFF